MEIYVCWDLTDKQCFNALYRKFPETWNTFVFDAMEVNTSPEYVVKQLIKNGRIPADRLYSEAYFKAIRYAWNKDPYDLT